MTTVKVADQAPLAEAVTRSRHYWNRRSTQRRSIRDVFPGEELAALRRGAGRQPGEVPAMWPFYRELAADGAITARLRAEHHTLVLFAFHQQAQERAMHETGQDFGAALRMLVQSGRYSEEALERRFAAAATATSADELAMHVRGLVQQLRTARIPTDYDDLFGALASWSYDDARARTGRRWAAHFFISHAAAADETPV